MVGAPAQNKFGTLDFLGEKNTEPWVAVIFFFPEDSGKNTCDLIFFWVICFKKGILLFIPRG